MKIVHRQPLETADISSARGTAGKEFWQLSLLAAVFLVCLYFSVGVLIDLAVSRISLETEARLFGSMSIPGTESKDTTLRLKRIESILEKLKSDPSVPPLPYRLILMENDQPNALAFPGGVIAITSGLIDLLDDNIGMAFVLGHELGHYHNRDHLQGMGRALGFQVVLALVFGRSMGAETFNNATGFVFQRQYSQDREQQADEFGLRLVHAIYGKARGVDRLFQIIKDQEKIPNWAYMFSTHPSPENRIKALAKYAKILEEND